MNTMRNGRIYFERLSTAGGYGYLVIFEVFDNYTMQWKRVSCKRLVWDDPVNLLKGDKPIKHETLSKIQKFIESRGGGFWHYRMISGVSLGKYMSVAK